MSSMISASYRAYCLSARANFRSLLAGKLKVDRHFSPCPVDEEYELFPNGTFVFNITKLAEFIQNNPDRFSCEEVVVKDFSAGSSV
jgi:hypothetical protein